MKKGIPYKWHNHVLTYSERATDSSDSIPMGNGDIGINLWIENEGDLLFYIAKSDAFSEHNQLLKLGRIRMSLTPNPFSGNQPYKLELDCSTGIATATAGDLMIEIWVDAFSPNIMVKMNRKSEFSYTVTLENWRQRPILRRKQQRRRRDIAVPVLRIV